MLELMRLCYEGVSPERFARDLDAKHDVILLFAKESGQLVGFSTIRRCVERLAGREVELIYSGDTVIHPEHWGSKTLQAAFGRYIMARKLRRPWRPCLWLLLAGGYKTYLMMVNHFPRSFPSLAFEPDAPRRAFLARLARLWFGDQYDPARGVVRFATPHYRVRQGIAPIDAQAATHPDVAFFAARNPGHATGDELVCLSEIRVVDLVRALVKIVAYQIHRPVRRAARPSPVSTAS
jgi:hypothetical protein